MFDKIIAFSIRNKVIIGIMTLVLVLVGEIIRQNLVSYVCHFNSTNYFWNFWYWPGG
ncbi:hypothetical protein IDJ75_14720 [Mucilaginibacter rigui]|uniref:ABC transporter permease n=1 Tax=Mucilaginibacter rigui TaxID=534635 RepID=A0ABR7X9N0_9SPHI|nr:hypothetical protein [Mucilaginibacter rigui]MBD1386537.1 hypothetical protein [Mucilaginibacter rigui]